MPNTFVEQSRYAPLDPDLLVGAATRELKLPDAISEIQKWAEARYAEKDALNNFRTADQTLRKLEKEGVTVDPRTAAPWVEGADRAGLDPLKSAVTEKIQEIVRERLLPLQARIYDAVIKEITADAAKLRAVEKPLCVKYGVPDWKSDLLGAIEAMGTTIEQRRAIGPKPEAFGTTERLLAEYRAA